MNTSSHTVSVQVNTDFWRLPIFNDPLYSGTLHEYSKRRTRMRKQSGKVREVR